MYMSYKNTQTDEDYYSENCKHNNKEEDAPNERKYCSNYRELEQETELTLLKSFEDKQNTILPKIYTQKCSLCTDVDDKKGTTEDSVWFCKQRNFMICDQSLCLTCAQKAFSVDSTC